MRARRSAVAWMPALMLSFVAALVTHTLVVSREAERAALRSMLELRPFQERYGPTRYSQFGEEWLIRDFFEDERGGVFLDVGANHYQRHSTTYYLERHLGWSGVAVEAQSDFAADYARYRPRTRFVAMFASDTAGDAIDFYLPESRDGMTASSNPTLAADPTRAIQVPTTTLTAVLDQAGVQRIDFLSMDIELAEPAALRGFDIGRFRPRLACIEAHTLVRQEILEYFDRHGYVLIGRYLRADANNLYFQPAAP